MAQFGWFLAGALLTLTAVVLGWALNQLTARSERSHAWARQVQIRQAEVLAELTAILEGHDLNKAAVTAMGNVPDRRRYFERWRLRLEAIIKELRTVAFLDEGDSRAQGFETADALAALLLTLDTATNDGATSANHDEVDERVRQLSGEVNALGSFWKG